MVSIRFSILCALAPLAACGSDDGVSPPSGPHYASVAAELKVPVNNMQATEYGLDLNGDKTVDNQLGQVLSTLSGYFDVQGAITEAVLKGDIILLADLQTPDFAKTSGAGLAMKLGDMEMPAACTDPNNIATCGQHLKGTGTFTIASNSPTNTTVTGKIAGGVLSAGPGKISLQIALGAMPVQLDLIGARAKASGMSDAGITTLTLAGAVTKTDLDAKVIPAIAMQITPLIARDCTPPGPPPGCGCKAGSTGKTVLGLFDTSPADCMVTNAEISGNSLIMALLSPDVTIDGQPSLSLGIQGKTVKAVFPTFADLDPEE